MYFSVPDDVYLAFFCEELIALDLKTDRYLILSSDLSETLLLALVKEFEMRDGRCVPLDSDVILPYNFDSFIEHFKKNRLLIDTVHAYPFPNIPKCKISAGADNVDWRMPHGELDKQVSKLLVLNAYFSLVKVYFLLRVLGFLSLINTIKKRGVGCVQQETEDFSDLATALNRACFLFPVKTKCLEWSAALVLMGLKRGWACNLEVGVQNAPFLAHAWVRAGKNVIADEGMLPQMLSVILSEPFS